LQDLEDKKGTSRIDDANQSIRDFFCPGGSCLQGGRDEKMDRMFLCLSDAVQRRGVP